MNQAYYHLATVVFKHPYFKDGVFKTIEVSFTENTMKLLKDLAMIVQPFKGGFHLLSARPELLQLNKDHDPLQFYLNCNDPYYINYTVLPSFKPATSLIYINNLETVDKTSSGELQLHKEDTIMQDNIIRLSHGQFKIQSYNSDKTYTFKNASDADLPDQSVIIVDNIEGEVAINNLSQGVVRVYDGETLVDAVYYYPNAVWKKPLGTIEIFTKALSNQAAIKEIDDNGIKKIEIEKVNYVINFENQKTYWKYFFVSEVYKRFKDLTIINSAREQIFEPEKDNTEALVLISKQPHALSEHPSHGFQLVNNFVPTERSETVIVKNLSTPSPEQIYIDFEETNESLTEDILYSHIYL